ncbi:hypothetical protein [Serratia quinivorans]|uniref:hypothetical protein n=1 Tax=Serratia quinivorans TaxID=137545 RepID=UPI0034C630A9
MRKNTFGNKKKIEFLKVLPDSTIEGGDLSGRCKFNFSYFDANQAAGQDFPVWSHGELIKLLEKIKHYTNHPLEYWRTERCGSGGLTIYANYKKFPKKSGFSHPKHVPHDVEWARFRLENIVRLVGFVIPSKLHQTYDEKTGFHYDSNTFYVVFLDKEHKFYISENA